MKSSMTKSITVASSVCDNTGCMSIQGIIAAFMDMASEHGTSIGLGSDVLGKKNMIWLATKTKIHIYEKPKVLSNVNVKTWIEKPKVIRCNRYYTLTDGEYLFAEGKNEWAMYNIELKRPCKINDIYPDNIEYCTDIACKEPFFRPDEDFSDCEELVQYKVASSDIDVSQHMNNVEYVRVALGALSCEKLEKIHITDIDIAYLAQCYEGELLSIRLRKNKNIYELGIIKQNKKTACIIQIIGK